MVFSVTSSIFYKKAKEICSAQKPPQDYHDAHIVDTQIWIHGMKANNYYMYLISPEDLKENRKQFHHCLLITAGPYDWEKYHLNPDNDLIVCPSTENICELANIFFTIFDQFRNWRNALNSILLTTESFREIFMVSQELLRMEFLLFNTSLEVLAVSDHFFGHYASDLPGLAKSFIQEIQQDEDHVLEEHFSDKSPYVITSGQTGRRLYACNIFFHESHSATLIGSWPEKEYETGDLQFFEYTGSMITDYYASYYSRIHHTESANRLIGLLTSISQGDLSGIGDAADILYAYGWLTYHTYLVLEFSFLQHNEIGFSREYFCSQIEDTFGNCVAFSTEESICCVMNLSLTDESIFMDKLPYFLRDNLCKAGLSNPCENFFSLHTCFSQARQALMLGQQNDPHFWSYRFSDYTFQYLLMQNTREYTPSQVIHPALVKLKKHDSLKHTSYFATLKAFLENNMNASQTAKKLYIHRSTFLQRLEQIKKITRIDLDNMQERAYLQMSFILDEQK